MAKKNQMLVVYVVGGAVALYLVDRYVLKGKLKISGYVDRFIGQIMQKFGHGAGPIIPGPGPAEGTPGAPETEEQFEKEMAIEQALDTEPETASWAYRRR